jgi:6-phosphogluconolactonase
MTQILSSRRQFLAASAALPFALRSFAQTPTEPHWVFLGTGVQGIYRAPWNAATGELGAIELAVATDRPTFIAMHPKLPLLYAANEAAKGDGAFSSFHVDATQGTLKLIQQVSSRGGAPCYVSVDSTGRSAFVADYMGGSMAAFALGPAGEITDAGGLDCQHNPACGVLGPVKDRQEEPHLHCATIAPGNDFLLVCDLGDDAIEVFPIAPGKKDLVGAPVRVQARVGSGPRHVVFHPNKRWVYCVHELDCTIDLYDWHAHGRKATLTLREGSTISTLTAGSAMAGNTGCEVLVSEDGRFIYTCTRGEDTISVYRVDATTGLLTEQQRFSCGGKIPRIIAFDPSRKWLVSCNQGGDGSVTVFAHEPKTGHLSETPKTFAAPNPMFAQWV